MATAAAPIGITKRGGTQRTHSREPRIRGLGVDWKRFQAPEGMNSAPQRGSADVSNELALVLREPSGCPEYQVHLFYSVAQHNGAAIA